MRGSQTAAGSGWFSRFGRSAADRDLVAYRRLALQIHQQLAATEASRSVLLTTPRRSEVSARTAVLLACAAADELGSPILLIDAAREESQASRRLGADGQAGLAELRSSTGNNLASFVQPTDHPKVAFLPAGRSAQSGTGQLQPLAAILASADTDYALTIIDGGSMLDGSAAASVAPETGCALLAIIEGETRMNDLEDTKTALSRCNAKRIGLLMTKSVRRSINPLAKRSERA